MAITEIAPPATEPSEIEDLVERVWTLVADGHAASVSEAVAQLWPDSQLSADTVDELGRVGLISLCHDRQSKARKDSRPPIGYGTPSTPAEWETYLLTLALSTPFEGVDGREKPLLDFDAADLEAFASRCEQIAKGWRERGSVARRTAKTVVRHRASRVGDLPSDVLVAVAGEWAEVWR